MYAHVPYNTRDSLSKQVGLFGLVYQVAWNYLARKAGGDRAFNVFSPPQNYQAKKGLVDKQGNVDEMVKAFRSLVFMCIHARAKAVASSAEFQVMKRSGRAGELSRVPDTHPMAELMKNPNPYLTPYFVWYLTVSYLDLTGNSYHWIARDGLKVPRALWPIPSQNVRIVPGNPQSGEGLIKAYIIDWGNGNVATVEEQDMLHLRHPNPNDPYYYGGSLVMRAAYEVDIADFIMKYQREFFSNDAVPAGIVTFPTELQPETRKAFEQNWLDKFKRKPGQIGYIEGDAKYQQIATDKEMNYLESFGINGKKIQGVFGVPDSELMMTEHIEARATAETMNAIFHDRTIEPLLTMIDQQLTLDLAVQLFSKDLVIQHKNTVPQNRELESKLDKESLDNGLKTRNEIRKERGYEPVAGGDEILVSSNLATLSQVVSGKVNAPAGGPGKSVSRKRNPSLILPPVNGTFRLLTGGDYKTLSDAEKAGIWKKHDRFRMKYELKLCKPLKRVFKGVRDEVLNNLKKQKSVKVNALSLFDVDGLFEQLRALIGNEATGIILSAFDEFNRVYGVDGQTLPPNNTQVLQAIQQMNLKTRTIPQTLLDELTVQINEGTRLNETVQQLSDRVSQFFNNTVDYRSTRIARTVSNNAVNTGNVIAARKSGLFSKKVWLSMRDGRVRDTHANQDGIESSIEDKFVLTDGDVLEVPGDPNGRAENVIGCRCTALFTT